MRSEGTLLPTLLLVLFVALKLTGHVDWSWLWVLSPMWVPMLVVVPFVALGLIAEARKQKWR